MNTRTYKTNDQPFKTILETVECTGLSEFYIRKGLRSGEIPHIKSGSKYLVNVPQLLEKLNRESVSGQFQK